MKKARPSKSVTVRLPLSLYKKLALATNDSPSISLTQEIVTRLSETFTADDQAEELRATIQDLRASVTALAARVVELELEKEKSK
jgi:hypothetical protein